MVSSVGTSFYKEPRMTRPYSRDSPSLRAWYADSPHIIYNITHTHSTYITCAASHTHHTHITCAASHTHSTHITCAASHNSGIQCMKNLIQSHIYLVYTDISPNQLCCMSLSSQQQTEVCWDWIINLVYKIFGSLTTLLWGEAKKKTVVTRYWT